MSMLKTKAYEENSSNILIQMIEPLRDPCSHSHSGSPIDSFHHLNLLPTEIKLSKNAILHHLIFCHSMEPISQLIVHQEKESQYHLSIIDINSTHHAPTFPFSDIQIHLNEPKASTKIKALTLSNIKQPNPIKHHQDLQLTVHHHKPDCQSEIVTRSVVGGKAKNSFVGKIIVYPGAHKTQAKLENKNLLLSDNAEVNSKPELEIYNEDVMCTHGSTVGYLDIDALFYLKSRGIPELEAKKMLIEAFMKPIQDVFIPFITTLLFEDKINAPIQLFLEEIE